MKVSGIWVLCLATVGTTLMFVNLSCSLRSTSLSITVFADSGDSMIKAAASRKLKENGYSLSAKKNSNIPDLNLEDYRPIDPVPSSKASIRPGPIEHGTPLNPYIPKPSPPGPGHPESGGLA